MKQIIQSTLLLLALLMPATATAHDFEVDGIYYNIDGTNAMVTYRGTDSWNHNTYSGSVIIPSMVIYNGTTYSVTSIGSNAFSGCSGLTSVTIPNSVTVIGKSAFSYCYGLTSVTIPNSVTVIGLEAFLDCFNLININIPDNVTSIEDGMLVGCSSLTSINIPESVTYIGENPFFGCTSLDTLNYNAVSCNIHMESNYHGVFTTPFTGLNLSTINIGDSVKRIPEYFACNLSKLTNLTIGKSVEFIGDDAFKGCTALNKVNINNLEAWCMMGFKSNDMNPCYYAHHLFFCGTEIKDLVIPNTVSCIGRYAFSGCDALNSVTIPNSVTSIGQGAFEGCYAIDTLNYDVISYVLFDPYVSDITGAYHPFHRLNISTINIGNSVRRIPDYFACGFSKLTQVFIPKSVIQIGEGAFIGCSSLAEIIVENGNSVYDSRDSCNAIIETATNTLILGCKDTLIPNSVNSIADKAFEGINLINMTIPNSITSIGNEAFCGCNTLTDVYCYIMSPSNVKMGYGIFGIGYYGDGVDPRNDVYPEVDYSNRTLFVPFGSLAAYQTDRHWRPYFGRIVEMDPEYLIGDTNYDGNFDIADITDTIDYLLGTDVTPFNTTGADINCNGRVDLGDLVDLIDMLLNR